MGAIAELTGDSSVGVRPSRRWLRPSARGLIDALVTQPPPATPPVTTVLPATTTVATALTSASRSAVAAAKCIAAAATTARPPTIGGSNLVWADARGNKLKGVPIFTQAGPVPLLTLPGRTRKRGPPRGVSLLPA